MSTWRQVPGFPLYEVSDDGRVWSHYSKRVLQPKYQQPSGGYLGVTLWRDGTRARRNIHALVLLAFVGPLPAGQHGRHLDGDPLNNRLENLAYGTPRENQADAFRHGTRGRKAHCKRGHEFTPENTTYTRRTGAQLCRACRRIREGRAAA